MIKKNPYAAESVKIENLQNENILKKANYFGVIAFNNETLRKQLFDLQIENEIKNETKELFLWLLECEKKIQMSE